MTWTWRDTAGLVFWTSFGAIIGLTAGLVVSLAMPWELIKAVRFVRGKPCGRA
jgi:hypothetical protein